MTFLAGAGAKEEADIKRVRARRVLSVAEVVEAVLFSVSSGPRLVQGERADQRGGGEAGAPRTAQSHPRPGGAAARTKRHVDVHAAGAEVGDKKHSSGVSSKRAQLRCNQRPTLTASSLDKSSDVNRNLRWDDGLKVSMDDSDFWRVESAGSEGNFAPGSFNVLASDHVDVSHVIEDQDDEDQDDEDDEVIVFKPLFSKAGRADSGIASSGSGCVGTSLGLDGEADSQAPSFCSHSEAFQGLFGRD